MKKNIYKASLLTAALFVGALFFNGARVMAEEAGNSEAEEIMQAATSISISPVSKILQIEANSVYEDTFKVTNNGSSVMDFEVYAAPYSYTFSEDADEYQLGFSRENSYTQITRWITFRDANGNYTENPRFTAQPGEAVEISYKISTPSSIPAGGQYAVLFAHTLSASETSSGIKTEASPGLVVYGRATGETITKAEISDVTMMQSNKAINEETGEEENRTVVTASAKVKNDGNVDFMAQGQLKITGLFGQVYYETPATAARVSVIPESELIVNDTWNNTPYFGIFRASWTVTAAGETSEPVTMLVVIMPAPILILFILLLTILIVWIIITVRKRKERRSKFMV